MAAKKDVAPVSIAVAEKNRKSLLAYYKSEPLVAKELSPLYEPYLGKVLQVSINGITIAMPVNGTTHKVPKSFADEIDSRRMAVDATIQKSKKMSNFTQNAEHYAGELAMF